MAFTEEYALNILEKIRRLDIPVIRMKPEYLAQDKAWVVELEVKDLVYQRFEHMNLYHTIEKKSLSGNK